MGTITRSFANNITTSGVLLPASLNNASLTNVTAYNAAIATGNMVLISSQTASASASISFTTGINSTYKEYQFWFINIHPSISDFPAFQASTDGGSNYGVTATTTFFRAQQTEAGADATLLYDTSMDLAQSTSLARLGRTILIDNDASLSGTLTIFNPSSTTYVKHYMYNNQLMGSFCQNAFGAGYFNTTSAINAIQFKMESGNIDDGTILMFGIK
jgi:hypothetical protein